MTPYILRIEPLPDGGIRFKFEGYLPRALTHDERARLVADLRAGRQPQLEDGCYPGVRVADQLLRAIE